MDLSDIEALIETFRDEDGFDINAVDVTQPFLIAGSACLKALFAAPELEKTLGSFREHYSGQPSMKTEGRALALMTNAAEKARLSDTLKALVPEKLDISHTRVADHFAKVWLEGKADEVAYIGNETGGMGSARLNMAGQVQVRRVPAAALVQLIKEEDHVEAPTMAEIIHKLAGLGGPAVQQFEKVGLSVATALLEPNSLLYVPPGYFVCYLTKNSKLHVQVRVPLSVRHDGLNPHVSAMHAVLSNSSTQHLPSQRDAQILASLMDLFA